MGRVAPLASSTWVEPEKLWLPTSAGQLGLSGWLESGSSAPGWPAGSSAIGGASVASALADGSALGWGVAGSVASLAAG